MADRPLRPATRRSLGELLPHQLADRPRAPPEAESISSPKHAIWWGYPVLAPVSRCYPSLRGRLLTCYSPVRHSVFTSIATGWTAFDLHVLGTPPAFVLSQDQTLHQDLCPTSKDAFQKSKSHLKRLSSSDSEYLNTFYNERYPPLVFTQLTFDSRAPRCPKAARTGFWLSLFRFQGTTGTRLRGGGARLSLR